MYKLKATQRMPEQLRWEVTDRVAGACEAFVTMPKPLFEDS